MHKSVHEIAVITVVVVVLSLVLMVQLCMIINSCHCLLNQILTIAARRL